MGLEWVIVLLILAGFLTFVLISAYRFLRIPPNNPIAFLKDVKLNDERGPSRIVLIGDSITHGTASTNYVNLVESRLNNTSEENHVVTINAGINGEFTYNVLQRLDPIIQCKPDLITILIGTNDAYGSFTPKKQRKEQKKWNLPELPDEHNYRRYLTDIVTKLKTIPRVHLALLSIPTIGEDPTTPEFAQSLKYGLIIKEVASNMGITYLPLNENMVAFLREHPSHQKYDFKWYLFTIAKSLFTHAFGRSWEKVAGANGFQLHTDHLHLSPKGAEMVTGLITKFYKELV